MNDLPFTNRRAAGRRLADALELYRSSDALVLGIPRGGVPVAAEVARAIGADLDVVVARKLGAPSFPELAIGAVTANGGRFLNEEIIRELGVTPAYIEEATAEQRAVAQGRETLFRGTDRRPSPKGRVVIIVDDGLATGATMRAAVRSVQRQGAAKVVVAVPVGAPETCRAIRAEVDELVCLHEPDAFYAVGAYYIDFAPVEDASVQQILEAEHASGPEHRNPPVAGVPPIEARGA